MLFPNLINHTRVRFERHQKRIPTMQSPTRVIRVHHACMLHVCSEFRVLRSDHLRFIRMSNRRLHECAVRQVNVEEFEHHFGHAPAGDTKIEA